jgi:hypothetical protein
MTRTFSLVAGLGVALFAAPSSAELNAPLADWTPTPAAWKGAAVKEGIATLTADRWSYLLAPETAADVEVSASLTVREPGKFKSFFGENWSVWPDKTFGDQGWDAAIVLRADDNSGYRVQASASLGEVALVKFPAGGYVRSVPLALKKDASLSLTARVRANRVTVLADGKELFSFTDADPLPAGQLGIGVNSGARVEFSKVAVAPLAAVKVEPVLAHVPNFSARKWLGGRWWVFDGAEPIMLLPDPASSYVNNVKLRPGVRPLLSFNSHWDVQNQGAYPEAKNDTADVKVTGGGKEMVASWVGKHETGRFATKSAMTVGWDTQRAVYTYDVESEMEVLPGEPFHFKYGFDFEHHTPLDPFNWQYLVFKKKDGTLNRRPVYPIDPGPQTDLEASEGLRVWHGRHNDPVPVCPAVEYQVRDVGQRKLNTAVCAAFYDTGVSFPAETLKAGEKLRVRYRYTGYPSDEATKLFKEAKTYDSPTLDPDHHFIFAEWPKVTFSKFAALSESWIYGRSPFMTGHNQRPTYELAKVGLGSGYAMKLGPLAFGAAPLPVPEPLPAGRYVLTVKAKGDNLHGPGGRVELTAADQAGKQLLAVKHFVGVGSFDWRQAGFAFDLPAGTKTLTLGFGNGGTGDVYFADAEFRLLKPGDPPPENVVARANATPAKVSAPPANAIAEYRMVEGRGQHALDFAGGPFGVLELANLNWVTDDGKPALKFADNATGKASYPKSGGLDLNYLRHPGYKGRDTLPVALAGHHGGGFEMKAFTLVSWVKPAAEMGKSEHGGKGDVLGVGGRRIVLRLVGQKAPYQLQAALNVNDVFTAADAKLDADRWYQVAVTGEPTADKKWRVRLYLDGKLVHEGTTKQLAAPLTLPPSVVLGAEIFYFHDAYYRGLVGRTLVFDRPLAAADLSSLKSVVE